jgi:hypothetical protein
VRVMSVSSKCCSCRAQLHPCRCFGVQLCRLLGSRLGWQTFLGSAGSGVATVPRPLRIGNLLAV